MPINVGDISVSLTASTAQFQAEMSRAEQAANKATAGVQSSLAKLSGATSGLNNASNGFKRMNSDIRESNASLALISEELGVKIPRHIRSFVSSIPSIGTALSAAFSGLAIIGVISVLVEAGKKVHELYEAFVKLKEGPEKVKNAFRDLNLPLQTSNDELRVTNDRLEGAIAKLSGKRENTIKLQLDEARVAADKLAESLAKDADQLAKVLKENSVSYFQRFTGSAGTDDISERVKDYQAKVRDITDKGVIASHQASTPAAADAINRQTNAQIDKLTSDLERWLNVEIGKSEKPVQLRPTVVSSPFGVTPGAPLEDRAAGLNLDQGLRLPALRGVLANLVQTSDSSSLQNLNSKLTQGRDALAGEQRNDPFGDKLRSLQAEVQASQVALDAAGKSGNEQVLAKSFGEAQKVIAALNTELEKHKQALTLDQQVQILTAEDTKALNDEETKWRDKLANTRTSIEERIATQKALNAAIGQGADAQRNLAVQTALLQALGAKDYADPAKRAALQPKVEEQVDAERQTKSNQSVAALNLEIAAVDRLTVAQGGNLDSIRKIEIENEQKSLRSKGATEEEIAATTKLTEAKNKEQDARSVAGINRQIEATKELTAAQWGGVEAIRAAEIAKIQNSGDAPQIIAAKVQEAKLQNQLSDIDKVRSLTHEKQLDDLRDELALLEKARETSTNKLAIDEAIKKVQQEIVAIEGQQVLVSNKAIDGIKQAMRELALETKSVAQEVHDLFKDAFSGINDELSKLLTGQKTSWGEFFRGLAAQMLKTTLANAEGSIFGKLNTPERKSQVHNGPWDESTGLPNAPAYKPGGILGKIFGGLFGGAGAKPDGSSASRALWVQMAGLPTNPNGGFNPPNYTGALPGIPGTGNAQGGGVLGSIFGMIGGALGAVGGFLGGASGGSAPIESVSSTLSFPARASGGDVSPGNIYEVGEQGTELFSPRTAGQIIPHNKLGGDTYHSYVIDARGTDPLLVEQRVRRAIALSHNSAIQQSGRAQEEKMRRTPQR